MTTDHTASTTATEFSQTSASVSGIGPTPGRRALWAFPWQYRESALAVSGVIAVGFLLQWLAGPFTFYLLHSPANLVAGAALLCCIGFSRFFRSGPIFLWLAGVPFAVCLIAAMLGFSLVMGLTPQAVNPPDHAHTLVEALGFTSVTSSWPFVLLYALILLCLGLTIVKRAAALKKRDIPFYLNHAGLWLLLFAAGLGSADMARYVMHVREGEMEWRVYSDDRQVLELPIAIRLKDFRMEEYPPKLAVIDRQTGEAQPSDNPAFWQIEEKRPRGALGEWEITLERYIHQAVRSEDGYREVPMPASTPAAFLGARHTGTGETRQGWVCGGGNIPGFFSALELDPDHAVVMTQPEPKLFQSEIAVLTKDGEQAEAVLEVNKPLRVGDWMIYQYGYDTGAGKMSSYSSMELVYDPWLPPVWLGLLLMTAGSLWLIIAGTGNKRKII